VGYPATTIEEIAARAGASKGTVYAHFPDGRDGLLRELYTDASQRTLTRARELHEHATDLTDQAVALTQATLEIATEPMLGAFYLINGPGLPQALGPVLGQTAEEFTKILTADLDQADLTTGVIPRVVAPLLVGAIREAGVLVCTGVMSTKEAIAGVHTITSGLLAAH